MRLQLEEPWIGRLCRLPETGMGYQRVDVKLQNGSVVNDVLVFNAEEMEWPGADSIRACDIAEIALSKRRGA